MEATKQIINILPAAPTAANEPVNISKLTAEAIAAADREEIKKPILTMEYMDEILSGEAAYPPELETYLNSNIEYAIQYDFYNGYNYEICNNHYYKIELTSYYRPAMDHITIQLNPDYNLLLDYMSDLNSTYYYSEIDLYNKYAPEKDQINEYRHTVQSEQLILFLYEITEEYMEQELYQELQDQQILNILNHKKYSLLRNLNYKPLITNIKKAWHKIYRDIQEEVDRKLSENFYEDVILPTEEYYINELLQQLPVTIKELPTL